MAEEFPSLEDEGINDRHPLADIGAMTLMQRGVSFAVDGEGNILRYPDGKPIDGGRIEDLVRKSGRTLNNADAAARIIHSDSFTTAVKDRIAELRIDA